MFCTHVIELTSVSVVEYIVTLQEAKYLSEHKEFRKSQDRVDRLFFNSLSGIEKYTKLWNVVQLLLLLSHGQASAGWGFPVNKEITTSNLMVHNLIACRVIKDHVLCWRIETIIDFKRTLTVSPEC